MDWKDATTNPSLILAASNKPGYEKLIDTAIAYAKSKGGSIDDQASAAMDRLVRLSSSQTGKTD
jgi:transaldolase